VRAKATTKHVTVFKETEVLIDGVWRQALSAEDLQNYESRDGISYRVVDLISEGHVETVFDENMYARLDSGLKEAIEAAVKSVMYRTLTPGVLMALGQHVTDILISFRQQGILLTQAEYDSTPDAALTDWVILHGLDPKVWELV
jgi:hypothetical protein